MRLTERYGEALQWAFVLHRAQERKGSGVPYLAHLMGVSSLAMEHGADEDEAIAALLHDAAEDQGGRETLTRVEERFGSKVASIVAGCSDWVDPPKASWRKRKERYLEHLRVAPPSVQLVSACDKLYNARAIMADYRKVGEALWGRFTGGREGILWYYRALASAFTLESPVVGELHRLVDELEREVQRRV